MSDHLPEIYTGFRKDHAAVTTRGFPAAVAALGWIDEVLTPS